MTIIINYLWQGISWPEDEVKRRSVNSSFSPYALIISSCKHWNALIILRLTPAWKKSANYYVHRKLSIWTVLTIFIKSGLHWRYNIQHYLSEERAWFIIILVQIKKNKKSENILWKFKPSKAKLLQLKLIQIIARAILLRKKLEIKKTKPFLLYQWP